MDESWGRKIVRLVFATPQRAHDGLNMRAWFVFFCFYMAGTAFLGQWGLAHYGEQNHVWAGPAGLLAIYLFYFSLACTYIPLPTPFFVLFLASPSGGLSGIDPIWRILIVAGLGALATAISHVNEYHVFTYLLRLGKVYKIRENRIYQWAEKQFKVWPFLLQVIFNIVPIPADPARWMAILSKYPIGRYFGAQWIGRFVRYGFLAATAEILKLNVKQIIGIQLGLFVITIGMFIVHQIRQRRPKVVEASVRA